MSTFVWTLYQLCHLFTATEDVMTKMKGNTANLSLCKLVHSFFKCMFKTDPHLKGQIQKYFILIFSFIVYYFRCYIVPFTNNNHVFLKNKAACQMVQPKHFDTSPDCGSALGFCVFTLMQLA